MGGDNNWLYFTRCPIVTASCSFYDKKMSGSCHNWLFYGDFMSLFTLWGVLVSGMRCSPKGPLGWLADILSACVCVGGGCLMIRYCIAYWLMCLGPKPGVVGVIWARIWPSSFTRSEWGTIEWKTRLCHCADGWLLSGPIQGYFSYISIQR